MSIFTTLLVYSLASPPGGGYTREQLKILFSTASQEFTRMESRCSTPASAEAPDLEAEAAFRRSADLMEIIVQNEDYPASRKGQNMRSDDISATAQALERAYMCHPGWEQRHYLGRAIRMLKQRTEEIVNKERRSLGDADGQILSKAHERLLELMRDMVRPPPPPQCVSTRCESPIKPPDGSSSAAPPGGYRGKYMELFSLRLELGFGIDTQFVQPDSSADFRKVGLFGVTPGVRFLVGRRKRHVFATGFRWNLTAFHDDMATYRVHQVVVRLEYGFRPHERWFSLHAAFEPGLQASVRDPRFGSVQLGGSGALCTGYEVFCVRFGGYSGTLGGEWGLKGMFLAAGVDVFRMADNILRRAKR
jgi:hypothetical protein